MALIETFEVGQRFAVTRSKHTGDRSYIHTVFEVVAFNDIDVKAKRLGFRRDYHREFAILSKDEYDFYLIGDDDSVYSV